jgi:hypothetical protein
MSVDREQIAVFSRRHVLHRGRVLQMARIIREFRTSIAKQSFLIVVTTGDGKFVSRVFRDDGHGHMLPLVNGNCWSIEFHDRDAHTAFDRALKFLHRIAPERTTVSRSG